MAKNIAFVFPGQGAQYSGMGKDFYNQYEKAKQIYDYASEICNIDVKKICFDSSDSRIHETKYTQIAIFTTSLAILECVHEMSYNVFYKKKEINLSPREFEVLYLLAQRPNWVIPKKNIYCSVWGSNYYDDQIPYKTVEHVVWKIRKKMGRDIIETLINVGYRLKKM